MNSTEEAIEFVESIKPGKVQCYESIEKLNLHYGENLSKVQQFLGEGLRHKKVLMMIKDKFAYHIQMRRTVTYTYEEVMAIVNESEQIFFPRTPKGRTAELLKELDKGVHELLKIYEGRMGD